MQEFKEFNKQWRKIIVIIVHVAWVFLLLQGAFQRNSSSLMLCWMQRSFKGTRVYFNFSGGLLWNLLESQPNKLCLCQFFTFSWYHLVPKIISLRGYNSRRTPSSAETFVWIRLRLFVWDFKLNFKFHWLWYCIPLIKQPKSSSLT